VLARAVRWVTEQAAFLVVVGLVAFGFGYLIVSPGRWGRVSAIFAIALVIGGALRAVLPSERAGLLAVRSRWLDTICMVILGGLILGVDIRLHR
jgi:hypothetical protein